MECWLRNKWKALKIVKCRLLPPLLVLLASVKFRFRDFCQFFEGLAFEKNHFFWKICSKKKVSVSFLENLVSEKTSRFRLKNLVAEKSLLRKSGRKKILVLVSENLISEKKKKITRKKLDQVNSANLLFEL